MKTDQDNLPALPEGWAMATIGDFAIKVQYGTSAKTSEVSLASP